MTKSNDVHHSFRGTVIFLGPLAKAGETATGGYEAANMRNIKGLRRLGVDVKGYSYPYLSRKPRRWFKPISYIANISFIFLLLFHTRMMKGRTTHIVHLTGLYKHFIYAELLLCLVSHAIGLPFIYDIRAGSLVSHYRSRTFVYRLALRVLTKAARMVLVEGKSYIDFLHREFGVAACYFPNHVDLPRAWQKSDRVPADEVRLVYFGRVVREKGVHVAAEAVVHLNAMGINARLDIIGHGDEAYIRQMQQNLPSSCRIRFIEELPHEDLLKTLPEYHFFIFPTAHLGEGQSNSLIEAMSCGLVPICSENGFNASVVGNSGAILPLNAKGGDYARSILGVLHGDGWADLSGRAREQVELNFNERVIIPNLIGFYVSIACGSS